MYPSAGDELRVKPGGLLIALVGFVLTRTLLVGIVYGDGARSFPGALIRLLPLVVGLGLVIYGVNLAVSTRDRAYARTVATWFLIGSVGMLLSVGLGALERPDPLGELLSSTVVANAVIGGGVGGILVGIRSARARRQQRLLSRQADQATLLNRLLRHEILNALTAIRGHAELLADGGADRSRSAVRNGIERIEQTVDDVGFLVRTVDETAATLTSVDPVDVVRQGTDNVSGDATVTVDADPTSARVRADEHLDTVVTELVGTALAGASRRAATVDLTVDDTSVAIRVSAPGQWLDDTERSALLEGVPESATPDADYGISIVRLLVAQYGGTVDAVDGEAETTVVVTLLRTSERVPQRDSPGVERVTLRNAAVAGIVAGVAMGLIIQLLSSTIGVIGALYGIRTVAVGWVTHLFHSVVFATVFVAGIGLDRLRDYAASPPGTVALGVVYGVSLWLLAAGVVMGVWLNLVGIPTAIPNLGGVSLLGHVVWGAVLGSLVHLQSAEFE